MADRTLRWLEPFAALPQPTVTRPRQSAGTTRSNDAPRRKRRPSFAKRMAPEAVPPERLTCNARPVGSATRSKTMEKSDGGAEADAITS